MSDDLRGMESTTHGSGQSVQVVIGHGLGIWLFGAVVVLVLLVWGISTTSGNAENRANLSVKMSEDQETNQQLILLWMREVKAAADAKGIQTPPIPVLKHTKR